MTAGSGRGRPAIERSQLVYDFAEGNRDQKDLLGGKGANLAEMTNLGLPVPPGLHDHHRGLPVLPGQR